jgi:phosphoglycolate/pyridoxal phosphate phosphatase family enzyme
MTSPHITILAHPTEKYDAFLFDCDGVLWRGAELLPGSARTLALLRARGKRVFFVTNNSSKSRAEYVNKFTKLSIPVDVSEIIPSSWAAAEYLRVERPDVKKAFVIGCQGLVDELALVGIDAICGADKEYATRIYATEADFLAVDADPDVGAVVCGWDLTFNYAKLCLASLHLQKNPGAAFVATNKDAFDKLADRNVPGNGCAVAAVEQSVGRMAVTVGKPSQWLVDRLLTMHGLDPRRTVVVGDRLDTDIQLGVVGDCDTVLVGTGCTSTVEALVVEEEEGAPGKGRGLPTYLLSHVGALSGEGVEGRSGNAGV